MNTNIINEIHSDDDSSEEDIGIDEQIARNLNSSNPIVVLFTIAKLIKILKPYTLQGKLSFFDLNLFKGYFDARIIDAPE